MDESSAQYQAGSVAAEGLPQTIFGQVNECSLKYKAPPGQFKSYEVWKLC